jgi:hypothetical protein
MILLTSRSSSWLSFLRSANSFSRFYRSQNIREVNSPLPVAVPAQCIKMLVHRDSVFMPVVVYNILLEFGRFHTHSGPLKRVLNSLGEAVSASGKVIERARASGDEYYLDSVADDEADVVEGLVGAAFVVSQTQITGVVSSIKRLVRRASNDGHTLTSCSGTKEGILQMASPTIGTTAVSRIQVIDAMANFFKHHDEWTVPWSSLAPNQKRTADIVVTVGGSEGSTGNLRTGLDALGIDYDRLDDLHDEISTWARTVIDTYERELQSRGLI